MAQNTLIGSGLIWGKCRETVKTIVWNTVGCWKGHHQANLVIVTEARSQNVVPSPG